MKIRRTAPTGVRFVDGYPIPAGGSGDGKGTGDGSGDGTDGEGEGTAGGDDGTGETSGTDGDGDGDDSSEGETVEIDGKSVVLPPDHPLVATMRSEREKRKAAERRARELETANEGESEAREREIRETAQAPAIRALRATAVETAAREAGLLYPEDAITLLSAEEREGIEVDLDADVPAADRQEAAKVVKALAKRRPGLVKPAEDGEGDDGQGAGGSDHQAGRNGSGSGSSSSSDPNATVRNLFRQKLGKS